MANKKRLHTHAETRDRIKAAYDVHGRNISKIATTVFVDRATVLRHLKALGLDKPLVGGSLKGNNDRAELASPPSGKVRRFLLTSAQNNTPVNEKMWASLNHLAEYLGAAIMVGTFTYNQNAYGKLAVKRGTKKEFQKELWYDERLREHIVDQQVELANGLVWCGNMNILPTASDPLSGLETYCSRKSAIYPHAKLAMRSIATMLGEGTKLMYTTGCVTVKNYIQKKEGIKAEHHHAYAALLVEVDDGKNWWVRQVACDDDGHMQDLNLLATPDGVVPGHCAAITWGDLHATMADETVVEASMDMLDFLQPRYQFHHDILEGASINRHQMKDKNPHYAYYRWKRGLHRVQAELEASAEVVKKYIRDGSTIVIPDSNHDGWWLKSWLAKYDYRLDPANAELFLKLQAFFYESLRTGLTPKDVNITEYALELGGLSNYNVKFLLADESFKICGRKIECGMHGHLGVNGAKGSPASLTKVGRRANTGHTHSAGIWNGLYVAGTSAKLVWDYNMGPSSWSHSHIVTYPNGMRTIVTMWNGKWRA